jgi:chromosome partitioning protein
MQTILFSSIKGGVGKSSLAILLSNFLAAAGKRVLCIDLDIQNSLTFYSIDDFDQIEEKNASLALHTGNLKNHIVSTKNPLIHLLPSSLGLIDLRAMSERKLRTLLPQVSDDYDFCIIDSAPTYDNIVLNAVHAADKIVTPARLSLFDLKSAQFYLDKLTTETDSLSKWNLLFNFYTPPRTDNPDAIARQYEDQFKNYFGDHVMNTKIPGTRLLQNAVDLNESISTAKAKLNLFDSVKMLAQELTGLNFDSVEKF